MTLAKEMLRKRLESIRDSQIVPDTDEIALISRMALQALDGTFQEGIEAAAKYCEQTLADNHPHASAFYLHAAANIRSVTPFTLDDGKCKSCIDDKCTVGPECIATTNPWPFPAT